MSNVFLTGQLVCSDQKQVTVVAQHLPLHIKLTRAEQGCLSFEVKPTQNPLVWQVDEQFQDAASFPRQPLPDEGSPSGLSHAPKSAVKTPPFIVESHTHRRAD